MVVNLQNKDEAGSMHGIPITEEAFERLDLELPLAAIYEGVLKA